MSWVDKKEGGWQDAAETAALSVTNVCVLYHINHLNHRDMLSHDDLTDT